MEIAELNQVKLPELRYENYEDRLLTLHLYLQIVGKIKLALMPWRNHWWHIPLFVSPRGLETGTIPYGTRTFEITFDLTDHLLKIETSDDRIKVIFLTDGLTVADFYDQIMKRLQELGISVSINATPYKVSTTTPFAEDFSHSQYDRTYVSTLFKILRWADVVFKEFSGRFYGKTCPVQLYWHSFDLVVTRFSGKKAPDFNYSSRVEREAYSHEVISFGFWPGDEQFRKPAFYSYTYPSPPALNQQALFPEEAYWAERNGSPLAILEYEHLTRSANPESTLLGFLQSAYEAGAVCAGWNREELEVKNR